MRYSKIDKIECCNGEGFGVSVFVQGCHFHCKNCFNPETWDFNGGEKWGVEQIGLVAKLLENPHITRLSILGGEPLANENVHSIRTLIRRVRSEFGDDKKIWLYTGYRFEDIMSRPFDLNSISVEEEILRKDIVLLSDCVVDGRYIDELKDLSLAFRGSSNQRIIDVKATGFKARGDIDKFADNIVLRREENDLSV